MADFKTILLSELLDCGTSDVDILEDIEYDVSDLIEYCDMQFGKVTFNGLVVSAFAFGLRDFRKSIDERIEELESAEKGTQGSQTARPGERCRELPQLSGHLDLVQQE